MVNLSKCFGAAALASLLAACSSTGVESGKADAADLGTSVVIDATGADSVIINRNIYGHFSEHLGHCIYGGLWVGKDSKIPNVDGVRKDVIDALKKIRIPNLRWPGGCFADEYHWKNGIGPKENRAKMVNTHWGGVVEDNSFGTNEFLNMCEEIGTEPYICGNVGSGSVEEMSEWVEYMTFDGESPMANLRKKYGREKPWNVKFFAVGNESWGCGGNMTPAYYSDLYRRYQTFARNYGNNHLLKVAGGPNVDDYNWTETVMKNVPIWQMWGLSLHYYVHPGGWDNKGSATKFSEEQYVQTMQRAYHMDELITKHDSIMTKYDPEKKVALVVDEWGAWYDVEPGTNPGFLFQQNTMRDALVAAVTLNIFHKHADRVRMANLAQIINVLQSIIFTDGDKMMLTPTYHIFDMYKVHQDALLLPSTTSCPDIVCGGFNAAQISASASKDKDGVIHVSLANLDTRNATDVKVALKGAEAGSVADALVVKADDIATFNDFDHPDNISLNGFDGVKVGNDGIITVSMPAMSVVTFAIK